MKKMKFEKPEMEKVMFEAEDVIVTSGGCTGNCNVICDNDCMTVCAPVCHDIAE
jgi:predicted oxidoreductase